MKKIYNFLTVSLEVLLVDLDHNRPVGNESGYNSHNRPIGNERDYPNTSISINVGVNL